MKKTVILLPTYNERENTSIIVPEIFVDHPDVYVLVIDDNSPDGTGEEVKRLMERYPHLDLLSRPKKQGLGAAYTAGMRQVLSDPEVGFVITMDADGSHAVEHMRTLREAAQAHDLVIGSRYVAGGGIEDWEQWRFLLSKWGNFYARSITGLPIQDMTSGFMCFHADLLKRLLASTLQASGYAFLMELKYRAIRILSSSYTEIPILFRARRGGESKISRHIITEGLLTPWTLRIKS